MTFLFSFVDLTIGLGSLQKTIKQGSDLTQVKSGNELEFQSSNEDSFETSVWQEMEHKWKCEANICLKIKYR